MYTCTLVLHGAVKVPKMDVFGHADPYVHVFSPAKSTVSYHKSKVSKGENPTWNEKLQLHVSAVEEETSIKVVLWDEDAVSDEYIGEATFSLCESVTKAEVAFWDKSSTPHKNTGARLVYSLTAVMDKYVTNASGVTTLSPQWSAQQQQPQQPQTPLTAPTTLLAPHQALPIAANPQQFNQYLLPLGGTSPHFTIAPNLVDAAVSSLLTQLSQVFAKYEVPMGLVSKLLVVSKFDAMEFIIDDSGSMALQTDMLDPVSNGPMTRWDEVKARFKMMLEVLCFLNVPPIHVHFLNSSSVLEIQKQAAEAPSAFLGRANAVIDGYWSQHKPSGGTPAQQRITDSFQRYPGKSVLRYFFGDGVPDNGKTAITKIVTLLMTRPNPEKSPFTFFSCTNNEKDTEWMKECEEAAPFVSEYDDFNDEAAEVLRDQGEGLPFSQGMYLIGTIVGAVFPDDLDCMDESVPFSKHTLEALLGYTMPPQQYEHYFNTFIAAQEKKNRTTAVERFEGEQLGVWKQCLSKFIEAAHAADIPQVREFKTKLASLEQASVGKK